jgi:hypothetical protein
MLTIVPSQKIYRAPLENPGHGHASGLDIYESRRPGRRCLGFFCRAGVGMALSFWGRFHQKYLRVSQKEEKCDNVEAFIKKSIVILRIGHYNGIRLFRSTIHWFQIVVSRASMKQQRTDLQQIRALHKQRRHCSKASEFTLMSMKYYSFYAVQAKFTKRCRNFRDTVEL